MMVDLIKHWLVRARIGVARLVLGDMQYVQNIIIVGSAYPRMDVPLYSHNVIIAADHSEALRARGEDQPHAS